MSSASTQPVASTPGDASGSSQRVRGPVEEVIAKRMRQLGKKLQRYRTYSGSDPSTLNADQKSGLALLPALEGAYKELEDLVREKGPVEEQELIQAAKLREATEAARNAAVAESSSNVEQYKASLVKPLSAFLRLHTILHPARSSDHEHLTFSALNLPSHLQDEVQATDVLRVGRMYEDLTSGGEVGRAVLDGLAKGKNGEDEEDDHIHHLLELLDQPEPIVESGVATPAEPHADFTGAALAESAEEAVKAVPEAAAEKADLANGHSTSHEAASSGLINFLQEDELESRSVQRASEPVAQEEDFEIVPQMEPHQTSGQQPPAEVPTPTSLPARSFAPIPTGNWADLDDDDYEGTAQPAASQSAVVNAAPSAESAVTTQGAGAIVSEYVKDTAERAETPTTAAESSSAPSARSPRAPRGAKSGRKPNQRPPRPNHGDRQPSQKQQQPIVQPGQKVVDEDGFETKARRGPQQPVRGGGQGGRGLPRGNGSFRGRGGGRGGRGAANGVNGGRENGDRPRAASGIDGTQGQSPKQTTAAAVKPSIYKSVQSNGPKSAPIS